MENQKRISDIPFEIVLTWKNFLKAFTLIREKRLWDGFWKYGWFSRFLLVVGVLVGIQFLWGFGKIIGSLWQAASTADTSSLTQLEEFLGGMFLVGSWKYLILILAEVLVFHLVRRTLEILSGEKEDSSFSAFLEAQKRMIFVAFYSWVADLVATIFISVLITIIGFDFLKPILGFLVTAYLLGFALTDNYFERKGISIRDSQKLNQTIIGVSLGLGAILSLLFLIPIVGPIIGTAVGAVSAALTLYYLESKGALKVAVDSPKEEIFK